MNNMRCCGIIEGYFGTPWSMEDRLSYPSFMAEYGYGFYIYAPKNDPFLRKSWDKPWNEDYLKELKKLKDSFNDKKIDFGIGFTPAGQASEIASHPEQLQERIREIDKELHPDYFALLFDDLKNSDADRLAYFQLQIADKVFQELSGVKRFIVCPSYYSFDPVLDRVFGVRPKSYWKEYAGGLDPHTDIFWTGEKVCSSGFSAEHLLQVAEIFGRKPFLWDNYPVNDGKNLADYLFLEPFSNRGPEICELTSGHGINPMREPLVNKLVLATLPFSYRGKSLTLASPEYWELSEKILGSGTSCQLRQDCEIFARSGRASLDQDKLADLTEIYNRIGTPSALEICRYLKGDYAFDPDCLT
ncbi:MAG: beta-N-acetylglucosaminidase domain-containing protein [Succinivibrionaceae bacterium]